MEFEAMPALHPPDASAGPELEALARIVDAPFGWRDLHPHAETRARRWRGHHPLFKLTRATARQFFWPDAISVRRRTQRRERSTSPTTRFNHVKISTITIA